MPLARDLTVDAFFSDEWSPLPVGNPRGVHFNRFTSPVGQPLSAVKPMQNPLDPSVGTGLVRAEQIPVANQGEFGLYSIFIPPSLFALAQLATPAFQVKVTLLFCVGTEFNRHGLRSAFLPLSDRVLITIPGIEASARTGNKAWGIGITPDMIDQLFAAAGAPSITNWVADTLAGYSTGHRGVNGTTINALLNVADIQRVIGYDALYFGDEPASPALPTVPTPTGVSPSPAGSGQNTWLMLNAVRAANPTVDIVTYEVTDGGTPRDMGRLRAEVPATRLIDLKSQGAALEALVLARVLGNGVSDGYFQLSAVPAPIASLIGSLPPRGTLASSALTAAGAASGPLAAWASANAAAVAGAVANATAGINLIVSNVLMGWNLRGGQVGEMLHDGFLQEFGWEFLRG
jgi:hypothetical protein